tara:strand:- start:723 stop:1871 length:1149 start_codon:yes stop_codon:yes gene_type:complete
MNKRKIIFFSTSRADFYLLSLILQKFKKSKKFKSYLVATGNHYEKDKGQTYKEILKKGLKIDYKVPYNLKNGSQKEILYEISKSIKKNFSILNKIKPDLILILGDRFELISIANTSHLLDIPIVHLHGGEVTEGAFDDSIRHSITKLSNIHFVCHKTYKKRLINMGEDPKNIYDVGGIGAELISHEKRLNKKDIEKKLNIKINKKIILVNLHPETKNKNINYFSLFSALKKVNKNNMIIFTSPNSDPGSTTISRFISKFKKNNNVYYFSNLGSELYFSLLRFSSVLIGNSSSGLLEAPILNTPSINLGRRQKGRLLEKSVLNCNFNKNEILKKINIMLNKRNTKFKIKYHINKEASKIILKTLSKIDLKKIKVKRFYDVKSK